MNAITLLKLQHTINSKVVRKLSGKVAVVTGASHGIGKAIAKHLCKSGAKVVLNASDHERLLHTYEAFVNEGWAVAACQADVSNMEDCNKLINHTIAQFGQIDILVNNSVSQSGGFFKSTCPEDFTRLLCLKVFGSVFPTIASLPYLKKTRGSIMFISSLAGPGGRSEFYPDNMTQMAQTSLAESLRTELFKENVHVGIVYAGKAENNIDENFLLPKVKYISTDEANQFLIDSQDEEGRAVIQAIHRRKFKTTIGVKGKVSYFVHKCRPWLIEFTSIKRRIS